MYYIRKVDDIIFIIIKIQKTCKLSKIYLKSIFKLFIIIFFQYQTFYFFLLIDKKLVISVVVDAISTRVQRTRNAS